MTFTDGDMNGSDERTDDQGGGGPRGMVPDELIDAVMASMDAGGVELLGENDVIAELTKRILERGLSEELTDHLGYEAGDPAGRGSGNMRNGSSAKTVLTEIGAVDLGIPRDRNGTFDPKLVPKHPSTRAVQRQHRAPIRPWTVDP